MNSSPNTTCKNSLLTYWTRNAKVTCAELTVVSYSDTDMKVGKPIDSSPHAACQSPLLIGIELKCHSVLVND